jgi:hypothetical protein
MENHTIDFSENSERPRWEKCVTAQFRNFNGDEAVSVGTIGITENMANYDETVSGGTTVPGVNCDPFLISSHVNKDSISAALFKMLSE